MTKWVDARLTAISWIVIAAALLLRLQTALGTYLNPDEALHVLLSNQHSLGDAYRASLTNAHPPLMFLVIYFWRWIGMSEVVLRIMPVLAGTAAIWTASRWVTAVLGRTAGFTALLLLAFSPFLIHLDAELRHYSLLFLWMSLALCAVDRWMKEPTPRGAVWISFWLVLSALTHYSALWFVCTVGLYVLTRLRDLPRRSTVAWAAGQLAVAAVYGVLYVTHISRLHGSAMEAEATEGWLRALYFSPGSRTAVQFAIDGTVGVFQVLFSHRYGGDAILLLFAGGAGWMLFARGHRAFAVLLIAPFALNAAAGLLRVYPYGGSRHCAYLILFAAAGAAAAVSKIVRERAAWVLAAAVVCIPYWHWRRTPAPQEVPRAQQEKSLMTAAMASLRDNVPAGAPIVTDYQSSLLLIYYLGEGAIPAPPSRCGGFTDTPLGGYRIVTSESWSPEATVFVPQVERWRTACGGPTSLWVFDGGWGANLLDGLPAATRDARRFGPALSLFRLEP